MRRLLSLGIALLLLFTLAALAENEIDIDLDDFLIETSPVEELRPAVKEKKRIASDESAAVTVSPAKLTLGVGESVRLTVQGDADGLSWSTSKKTVATVSDGVVKGKAAGTAVIRLKRADGTVCAECAVTVKKAPGSVKLGTKTSSMAVGMAFTFKATISSGTASYERTWTSGSPEVAEFDSDGTLHALSEGETKVTVRTFNGKTASCTVTVKPAPTGVVVTKRPEAALCTGESFTFEAALEPEGAYGKPEYISLDPDVASFDGAKLTAKLAGTARVGVRSAYDPEVCESIDVTILQGPVAIRLNRTALTLGAGESFDLTAESPESQVDPGFRWKPSKANVAVDESGHVTAKKTGSATVTVTSRNGKKASCKITVKKAPSKVTLNKKAATLPAQTADALKLKASLPAGSASRLTWTSDAPGVATVEGGVIATHEPGTARITVETYNHRKASCTVTVKPRPTDIVIDNLPAVMGTGTSVRLKAHLLPEGAYGSCSFKLYCEDDKALATLKSGTLKAVKTGRIVVMAYSSFDGEVYVHGEAVIEASPSALKLNATSLTLGVGEAFTLAPDCKKGADIDPKYSFKSSKPGIADVDASGNITPKAPGTATITVRTYNGKTASCKLKVGSAPKTLKLSKTAFRLGVGMAATLTATPNSGAASRTKLWASDDASVATVEGGTVKALREGSASVTAQSYNGVVSAPCLVEVVPAPTEVFAPASITLAKGKSVTPKISFGEGELGSYKLLSDRTDIVGVSGNKLTAKKKGKAVITVMVTTGETMPCTFINVTVK